MPTHYQVLGVHTRSEIDAIRSAYLKLIKRHHPDLGQGRAPSADVYRINLAYSILRDPEKRARYDADLLRTRIEAAALRSHLPVVLPNRRRSRSASALLIATAFAALLFVPASAPMGPEPASRAAAGPVALLPRQPASAPVLADEPPPDRSGIIEMAGLAGYMPLERAVAFSTRCIEDASATGDLTIADQCVAFDLAYGYWHADEFHGSNLEGYFQPMATRRRDQTVLASARAQDPNTRLQSLQSATFAALTDSLTARQAARSEDDGGNPP